MRASSAQRYALCPGSGRASWGLPSGGSSAADRGTRIHEWLAASFSGDSLPALKPEEEETARQLKDSIEPYFPEGELTFHVEKEMEAEGWTGHVDLIVEGSESDWILVVDWKTGWGELPEPAVNAQLRVYAFLASRVWKHHQVRATLVTPRGVQRPVQYGDVDMLLARKELEAIKSACESPGAPRIPDPEACKYCPAFGRASCPETCKAIAVMDEVPAELTDIEGGSLGRLGAMWKLAEKRGKQIEAEIRRRLEDGAEVTGCRLSKPTFKKQVYDIGRAFAAMRDLSQEQFLDACTVSIPKLADAYADAKNTSKAQARRDVEALLVSVIEAKEQKGKLMIGGPNG